MAQSVEAQIEAFLARYSSEVSAQLHGARVHLRSLFPRGHELVYDNYNALVFAFSPTERTPQAFLSIAGYPKWVTLFFLPWGRLERSDGSATGFWNKVRSIRLTSAEQLAEPAVHALVAQAIAPHQHALAQAELLQTTIKLVSPKQRPRRPAGRQAKRENAA
jgi:hypothetical protein